MNKKLKQVLVDTTTLAIFATVLIVGIGALTYTGAINLDIDSNTSQPNNSVNITVVPNETVKHKNISCTGSNTTELKRCVDQAMK